ncbi:MAG: enoyl-CoA hydratase-related protein [Pseudomonadota bacterium]
MEPAQSSEGCVSLDQKDLIAYITLNNPGRLNAMRLSMWRGLAETCEALKSSKIRVVIIKGSGARAFSAGADVSEFPQVRSTSKDISSYNAMVARALQSLAALPMPVIAVVQGHCIGGGLEIALRCDLRLAADTAQFAFTPAKLGLAVGTEEIAALAHIAGPAAAAELLYTARPVPAERAERWGLVNQSFPSDLLEDEAAQIADTIASNAPLTLRAVKAGLRAFSRPGDTDAARHAESLVETCYASADYREGQAAFAAKRRPVFQGH